MEQEVPTLQQELNNLISESGFFGGIVAYKSTDSNMSLTIYVIVDGQQRLITILLMMAYIKLEYTQLIEDFKSLDDKDYAERATNKLNEITTAFEFEKTNTLGKKQR